MPQEEESHPEKVHPMAILAVAVPIHLHLRVQHLHSRQEEQVSPAAIATLRGDAQRYWLTQVLEPARARHDQWLQSSPAQRDILEPAYILGDRKHTPDAANAVESVLRTELLDVIPKV